MYSFTWIKYLENLKIYWNIWLFAWTCRIFVKLKYIEINHILYTCHRVVKNIKPSFDPCFIGQYLKSVSIHVVFGWTVSYSWEYSQSLTFENMHCRYSLGFRTSVLWIIWWDIQEIWQYIKFMKVCSIDKDLSTYQPTCLPAVHLSAGYHTCLPAVHLSAGWHTCLPAVDLTTCSRPVYLH